MALILRYLMDLFTISTFALFSICHVCLDHHFVRNLVLQLQLTISHVFSINEHLDDLLTKLLSALQLSKSNYWSCLTHQFDLRILDSIQSYIVCRLLTNFSQLAPNSLANQRLSRPSCVGQSININSNQLLRYETCIVTVSSS